jgi:ABC-type branched-subunit amino acid transport system substrate-binding protein
MPSSAKVGLLVPLSGAFGFLGSDFRDGFQLRLDQVNESNDLLPDTELEVVVSDTESDPQAGLSAARDQVTNENVDVLIGGANSETAAALSNFAAQEDIPILLGMSVNADLTLGEDCKSTTARLVHHNKTFNRLQPKWGVENVGQEAYVLYPDYETGYTIRDTVGPAIEAAGGTVAKQRATPLGTEEWGTVLDDIQSTDPDWLFMGVVAGQISLLTQAVNRGFSDIPILPTFLLATASGQMSQNQLDQLPPIYRAARYPSSLDNELNNAFKESYESRFETPAVYASGFGYMNGGFYANALAEAGSKDTGPIMDAIEGLTWEDIVGTCAVRECNRQGYAPGAIEELVSIDEERQIGVHEVEQYFSSEDVFNVLPACDEMGCSGN